MAAKTGANHGWKITQTMLLLKHKKLPLKYH
jgi:hypothetical protein